jgi:ribose-phosphate pyrophosphokinase
MKYYSLNKSKLAQTIFGASKISNATDKELSIEKFADGEILPRFSESLRGEDAFIIADGNTPDDVMKLFLVCDAAKRSGSKKTNVILPFKYMPLEKDLMERLLLRVGVKKLILTKVVGAAVEGFHSVDLSKNEDGFAEFISSLDKKFDKKGEVFYSINKTPLAQKIFDMLPYYHGSDECLTIDRTIEGTYIPNFTNNLKGKDVFIVADGHHSEDIMKLLATISAANLAAAKRITVVMPYAPYSRQDKNDHIRSSIGAKMLADILQEAGMDQMIVIELHAGSIQGFYDIPIVHLDGKLVTSKYVHSMNLEDLTFCAPDAGASKRTKSYAKGFPDAISDAVMDKGRKKPNEVASMSLIGDVKGRNVLSPDDLGDTMGTMCIASDVLYTNGAKSTRGIITHFVASSPEGKPSALENIAKSSLTELITTDTIPSVYEKVKIYNEMIKDTPNACKLTIQTCAPVLARAIDKILKKESINELNTAEA